jgi:hypothetical protein
VTRLEQRDRRARLAREVSGWLPPARKRGAFLPHKPGPRKRPRDPCLCASCIKADPSRAQLKRSETAMLARWLRASGAPRSSGARP